MITELRTALTEEEIVDRVQQQMNQGYHLVCVEAGELGDRQADRGRNVSD